MPFALALRGMTLKKRRREGKEAGRAADKESASNTNTWRTVFVTARFNPDLIPKPALEPLPTAKKPDETKPEPKKPDEIKSPEKKPEEKKPADDQSQRRRNQPRNRRRRNRPRSRRPTKSPTRRKIPTRALLAKRSEELLALADTPPADKVDEKKPDEKKTDDQKPQDSKTGR